MFSICLYLILIKLNLSTQSSIQVIVKLTVNIKMSDSCLIFVYLLKQTKVILFIPFKIIILNIMAS